MITYVAIAILALVVVAVGLRRSLHAFRTYRGMRLLTCPENRQPAAVELRSWRAALTASFRAPVLQVGECSRWPERAGCDQACARDIQASPAGHLVNSMLAEWSHDRPCVCCGAPLSRVHIGPHQPHLMSPDRKIVEWKQIPPQNLLQTLDTCGPVCENCLLAETHTW